MNLTTRDRNAVLLLGIGIALILVIRFGIYGEKTATVVAATDSIPLAEKRLERLRQVVATAPGKEAVLKQVNGELRTREKGIISAETAPQAQAQLLQVIRRIAKTEGIDTRGSEIGQVRDLGDAYGEVFVSVSFECRIEQFVNFLTALTREPQLLATSEIRASAANLKEKRVGVRLALAGVVARKLVPQKKGLGAF